MKKILILLIMVLTLSLCGCKNVELKTEASVVKRYIDVILEIEGYDTYIYEQVDVQHQSKVSLIGATYIYTITFYGVKNEELYETKYFCYYVGDDIECEKIYENKLDY